VRKFHNRWFIFERKRLGEQGRGIFDRNKLSLIMLEVTLEFSRLG
jgi:hypothetical protein